MPLDATPHSVKTVSKTHIQRGAAEDFSAFGQARRRASRLYGQLALRTVRSHSALRLFVGALGLLVREARRDPETASAICRQRGAKGWRLEVRMTRLICGPRDPEMQGQDARWANAAAYIAHPPNGDKPPSDCREAVQYIDRRGGVRKLSKLYANRHRDTADDSIDCAFVPRDLASFMHGRQTHCEWCTPAYVISGLNARIDLDPASPGLGMSHVPATVHFTRAQDGLAQPWPRDSFVWLNPPHGRCEMPRWVQKFTGHAVNGGDGVMLVSDRTSTKWHQNLMQHADVVLFLAKKLKFETPTGARIAFPIGSHLVGVGERGVAAFINAHRAGLGALFKPYRPP